MHLRHSLMLFAIALCACSEPTQSSNDLLQSEGRKTQLGVHSESNIHSVYTNAFVGNCVQNMPQLEKVASFARISDWEVLSDDMLIAFGPAEPNSNMKGWMVKPNDEALVFLGTTDANIDGERHRTCSIAVQVPDPEGLVQNIVSIVQADKEPKLSEIEAGQRYRVWAYNNLGDEFRLIVMDAPELAPGVVTISSNHSSK